jgi:hypothetical protein
MGTCQSNSPLLERTRITHPTFEMRLSRFPALYTLNRVPVWRRGWPPTSKCNLVCDVTTFIVPWWSAKINTYNPTIATSQKLFTFCLETYFPQSLLVQISGPRYESASFPHEARPRSAWDQAIDHSRWRWRLSCPLLNEASLLDDCQNFNALSYCWGDSQITAPFMVDYHAMSVTVNLEKALRQIRRSAKLGEIWVDAICS